MAASKQAIKSRIASVESTKKITNAMQMVASAKLNRIRASMQANREYADGLQELLAMVLARADQSDRILKGDPTKPAFLFVITSDMGLCGGYNANVYKKLTEVLKEENVGDLVMIGSRGEAWARARSIDMHAVLIDVDDEDAYARLSEQMDEALRLFREKKIGKIQVLYTHYKNTLTFEPELETLLPPEIQPDQGSDKKVRQITIFEPEKSAMLAELIPMITRSVLYSKYMESKTSEQASRRMAMENATDNAEELEEKLNLEYNRVRQSAITQEITEIVGGANALK